MVGDAGWKMCRYLNAQLNAGSFVSHVRRKRIEL